MAQSKGSQPQAPGAGEAPFSKAVLSEKATVTVYGTLREMMHQGRLEGRVTLAEVAGGKGVYALGALEGLSGEVTVLDGEAWVSRPHAEGARTEVSHSPSGKAALLVVARVARWRVIPVARDVAWEAFDAWVAAAAVAAGMEKEGPFPFLIEGPVRQLRWHIIDGRRIPSGPHSHTAHAEASLQGGMEAGEVSLVGFYSKGHRGVFTHMDSTTHVHVIDRQRRMTGHVDALRVQKGARLHLPAQEGARRE